MNVNMANSFFRGLALDGFTFDREDAGLTSCFRGETEQLIKEPEWTNLK